LERVMLRAANMNVPLRSNQVRGVGGPARYRELPGSDRVELTLFVAQDVQFPDGQWASESGGSIRRSPQFERPSLRFIRTEPETSRSLSRWAVRERSGGGEPAGFNLATKPVCAGVYSPPEGRLAPEHWAKRDIVISARFGL